MIKTGQHAIGKYKLAVVDSATKEVVWEQKEWGHNLILNVGMAEVGIQRWSQCFDIGIVGTSGAANSRGSLGTTAECTSNGTVTLNGGVFAFSAGTDVGNILQWDTGQEHRIDSVTSPTQAHVVPAPSGGTITPGLFTFYHANRTAFVAESKRTSTMLTGLPFTGSSLDTGIGRIYMRRTFDFSSEGAPVTYREVGVGWNISPAVVPSTFARIVVPGGVPLLTGQQLRLTYQLEITMSPITPVAGDANVVGWPVAPSVNTTGTYQLQLVSMGRVETSGLDGAFVTQNWLNEPSNTFRNNMWMTNSNAALAAFNAAPPARENLAFTDKWGNTSNVLLNTQGIVFYVYKSFTWAASTNVHTNHRSFGLGYAESTATSPPSAAAWTFVLDQNQSKSNTQTLTLATLHQWSRALVPDETP